MMNSIRIILRHKWKYMTHTQAKDSVLNQLVSTVGLMMLSMRWDCQMELCFCSSNRNAIFLHKVVD